MYPRQHQTLPAGDTISGRSRLNTQWLLRFFYGAPKSKTGPLPGHGPTMLISMDKPNRAVWAGEGFVETAGQEVKRMGVGDGPG